MKQKVNNDLVIYMVIKYGTTRVCFLIGNYCIKLPCFKWQWTHGLLGLINNTNEYKWSKLKNKNLAKCYFKSWGGFVLNNTEWNTINYNKFITESMDIGNLPIENKKDSFGITKNGKIVAIDYH